jgi:hypothetical protein
MQQALDDLLTLTGLCAQDYAILHARGAVLSAWSDELVAVFYDTLYQYPATATIFKEGERPQREQSLRQWYDEICNHQVDSAFWQKQWRVGLIHIARKVTTPFMLGMISRVQQVFLHKCLAHYELAEALEVYGAFKRLTDVIGGLIAESYFVNYIEAMENVGGLKLSLVQRMIDLEIAKKLKVTPAST